ncbi:MAG: uridine kinase [Humibacillus sp.]|nr:uridine kinase [Humibacillus sp.]MDN5775532.1 uridine kinase [Humibacillus sp.]
MRPSVLATQRRAAVRALAEALVALAPGERVAVAVDGVDGVGKTVLADQLAEVIGSLPDGARTVVRVGIDGFHHPRARRYARGTGPDTFYDDSYDYEAIRTCVLEPFRSGRPLTPAVFDVEADKAVTPSCVETAGDTLLLVDGIFLQRSELAGQWDAVVFVDAPFAVTVPRGNVRFDGHHDPDPEAATNRRYVEGQRLYVAQVRPREQASWVFDNTDLDRPLLSPRGSAGGSPGAH